LSGPRQQFQRQCEKWARISEHSLKLPADAPFFHLSSLDQKTSDQLIKELITHRLAGYYFLQKIDVDGDDLGYVVLLREVHHMHRVLAERLARAGISFSEFQELCRQEPFHSARINIKRDETALAISTLMSPHIEHILQVFSHLFGRIGLPDAPSSYMQEICSRQPSFRRFGS
jgi:hypothetical protein